MAGSGPGDGHGRSDRARNARRVVGERGAQFDALLFVVCRGVERRAGSDCECVSRGKNLNLICHCKIQSGALAYFWGQDKKEGKI